MKVVSGKERLHIIIIKWSPSPRLPNDNRFTEITYIIDLKGRKMYYIICIRCTRTYTYNRIFPHARRMLSDPFIFSAVHAVFYCLRVEEIQNSNETDKNS